MLFQAIQAGLLNCTTPKGAILDSVKKILWFSAFQILFTGMSEIEKGNSKNPISSYHLQDFLSNFHIGHVSTLKIRFEVQRFRVEYFVVVV